MNIFISRSVSEHSESVRIREALDNIIETANLWSARMFAQNHDSMRILERPFDWPLPRYELDLPEIIGTSAEPGLLLVIWSMPAEWDHPASAFETRRFRQPPCWHNAAFSAPEASWIAPKLGKTSASMIACPIFLSFPEVTLAVDDCMLGDRFKQPAAHQEQRTNRPGNVILARSAIMFDDAFANTDRAGGNFLPYPNAIHGFTSIANEMRRVPGFLPVGPPEQTRTAGTDLACNPTMSIGAIRKRALLKPLNTFADPPIIPMSRTENVKEKNHRTWVSWLRLLLKIRRIRRRKQVRTRTYSYSSVSNLVRRSAWDMGSAERILHDFARPWETVAELLRGTEGPLPVSLELRRRTKMLVQNRAHSPDAPEARLFLEPGTVLSVFRGISDTRTRSGNGSCSQD